MRQVQNSDRINSDRLIRVGSTRINPDRLKFEHNKRKGTLNKRKRILLRIYGSTVMKIEQSLLSCAVLSSRHFVFLVTGPRGSSLRCPVSSRVLGHNGPQRIIALLIFMADDVAPDEIFSPLTSSQVNFKTAN